MTVYGHLQKFPKAVACGAMESAKELADGIQVPERYTRQAALIPQGDLFRPLARQTALHERIMAAINTVRIYPTARCHAFLFFLPDNSRFAINRSSKITAAPVNKKYLNGTMFNCHICKVIKISTSNNNTRIVIDILLCLFFMLYHHFHSLHSSTIHYNITKLFMDCKSIMEIDLS